MYRTVTSDDFFLRMEKETVLSNLKSGGTVFLKLIGVFYLTINKLLI